MSYKVYYLADLSGRDIFYVGMTKQWLKSRLADHISIAKSKPDHNFAKSEKIRLLNYNVSIATLESGLSMADAKSRERFWIKRLYDEGAVLTNVFVLKGIKACSSHTLSLKSIRQLLGLSLKDVHDRTGLTEMAIFTLEVKNSLPTKTTSKKMALAYGIPSFILRATAILSSEGPPDDEEYRDCYDKIQCLCMESVSERTNGRKKQSI